MRSNNACQNWRKLKPRCGSIITSMAGLMVRTGAAAGAGESGVIAARSRWQGAWSKEQTCSGGYVGRTPCRSGGFARDTHACTDGQFQECGDSSGNRHSLIHSRGELLLTKKLENAFANRNG